MSAKSKKSTIESNVFTIPVDIVFLVDVTGSMGSFIGQAKKVLANSMKGLESISKLLDIRYSLIVYRDHPPQDNSFASKILVNCGTYDELNKGMHSAHFSPSGGGDAPESGLDAINDIKKLSLRTDSIRYAFLAGDAPLHGTNFNKSSVKCACGLTADSVKTIVENTNITICGVNLSGNRETNISFQNVCSTVVDGRQAPEKIIVEKLTTLCKDITWAHDTLLPELKVNKFKAAADLAIQFACSIKQVNNGIETLNIAGLTNTL